MTIFLSVNAVLDIVNGNISWFNIVTLTLFALALVNFILELFMGGYYFYDNRLTIKQGIMRQHILYDDIRRISLSENFASDLELDRGEKNPIAINVKNKEGFLAQFYQHRPDLEPPANREG